MKTRFAPAFFVVALLLSATAELHAAVTLRFSVNPARTLQAIPASFTLRVENESDAAVVLPRHVLLRVFAPDREAFIATFGFSQERPFSRAVLGRDDSPVRLAPHERRTFTFAAATLDNAPGWFVDPRMGAPGTYRMQMLLADGVSDDAIFHVPATEVESVVPVRLMSDEAVLTITAPTEPDDIAVLQRLAEFAKKRGGSATMMYLTLVDLASIAHELVARYPRSHYAPYLVQDYIGGGDDRKAIELARRVALLHPNASNRDHLHLFIARLEANVGGAAEAAGNIAEAMRFLTQARNDFSALARDAADPDVRRISDEERANLPPTEELQRQFDGHE